MKLKNLLILIVLLIPFVIAGDPYWMDENLEMGENDIYNATNINATNFFQDGSKVLDIDDINGTTFNYTRYSNESLYWNLYRYASDLNNLLTIPWGNITNKFITAVSDVYLYMSGTTIHFNETLLNETIDKRSDFDTRIKGDGIYLYNDSTTMYLNETKLNITIDDKLIPFSTTVEIIAFGYYNGSDFVITDYFTKTSILGFGYYNGSDFVITDYLTSAKIYAYNYYNSSDFSISDYITSATLLGYSYYNASDFVITDYYTKTQVDAIITGIGNFSDWDKDWNDLINKPTKFGNSTAEIFNAVDNETFSKIKDEGDLNVNHSDSTTLAEDSSAWITMISLQARWLADIGNVLTFDETELNATIDAKLVTTYFNATSLLVVTGTGQGAIGDLQTYNNIGYNVSEVDSDFDLRINFTGVTGVNQLVYRYKTGEDEPHVMHTQIWDYNDGAWEGYAEEGARDHFGIFTYGIYDEADHISGGLVQVRFYTTNDPPNTVHKWEFDWITISDGLATPSSSESDPFFRQDGIYRDGTTPLTGDWPVGPFDITADTFIGNLSCSNITGTTSDLCTIVTITDTNASTACTGAEVLYGNGTCAVPPGGTYSANKPLNLTGSAFGLINCADTEIYKTNATGAWVCSDDDTIADTNASTACSGTTTYLDGEGNCDDISDVYRAESWDNITGIPTATPSDGDTTHFSLADEIYDWVINFAYASQSWVTSQLGSYWNTSTDLDTVISADEISESKIEFTTACSAGDYYRLTGNDLECTTPTDTTYLAGSGISETGETFTVAAGAGLDQESSGLKVEPDGITDTELAYDTGQALTTTSNPTFNNVTITECIPFASGGMICSGS